MASKDEDATGADVTEAEEVDGAPAPPDDPIETTVRRRPSRGSVIFALPSRSVRSRVLLVFITVSVLLIGAVVIFVQHQGEVIRDVSERIARQEERESNIRLTRELLEPDLQGAIARLEQELSGLLAARFRVGIGDERQRLKLAVAFWNLSIWDDPQIRNLVRYAALIHRPDETFTVRYFNVRSDMVFPSDRFRRSREPGRMVDASLERDDVVLRGERLAGPLRVVGANWGGYYLQLYQRPGVASSLAEHSTSRSLLLILLLLIPGLVFLFGFTWRLISTRLLEPVEELGRAARQAGRGDYSRRLVVPPDQHDEVAKVMSVFNRMMSLVEEYRDDMESKVADATEEIARKNQQLMLGQRLAATGTLASGIAHEINNPLGGMLNVARRLQREDLTEEQRRKYIEILEEGIERIGSIVRKVLEVSPRKTTPIPLRISEALEHTIDLVAHRASRGGVTIENHFPVDLPLVLGESNEIGQVFLNLLINAVDACAPDGGRVEIRAEVEDGFLCIMISDDGVGMEPEVADRAFDMFFTTKDAGEGTGLGLATVLSLVQSHGGTLELQTAPGDGTTFFVRLPLMVDP